MATDPGGTGGRAAGHTAAMSTMASASTMLATSVLNQPLTLVLVDVVSVYVVVRRRRAELSARR